MPQVVTTPKAPAAIGPYSQAIAANGLVFVSGQIPINPSDGKIVKESIAEQTRQVLTNLAAILAAAGTNLEKVVKTTVYLKNMHDFDEMNHIYGEFFGKIKPARATVEVARLPKDVSIEIDAIALG